jgi:hypothetical protein
MGSVALGALLPASTRGAAITEKTLTETASIPLTSTDFGGSNGIPSGAGPMLKIAPFNTHNGAFTLDSVSLSFHAMVQDKFGMTFTVPATITDSVATGSPSNPGPAISLFEPDGKTPILTVKSPNDPSVLARTVTYGGQAGQTLPQQFSSSLPSTSPFYLAPATSQGTTSLTLTSATDLAQFTGTSTVNLPVVASAIATIKNSAGNGSGLIATNGGADVTVTYQYHSTQSEPQTIPEPVSVVVWSGLAGIGLLVGRWRHRRAAGD